MTNRFILVVEDSPEDVVTLVGFWRDESASRPVVIVRTGELAMEFIDEFGDRVARAVVDFGLPGDVQGPAVIARAKERGVPDVQMVTKSRDAVVFRMAYDMGADGCWWKSSSGWKFVSREEEA